MSQDNGGPAFPNLYPRSDEDGRQGMTLLDYFAGQALTNLTASEFSDSTIHQLAKVAYDISEAMLAERARRMK